MPLRRVLRFFSIIFLLLLASVARGQEGARATNTGGTRNLSADTSYVGNLLRQAKKIERRNMDSAFELIQQAFAFSVKSGYADGAAISLLKLAAISYNNRQDVPAARNYYKQAFYDCNKAKFRKGKLLTLYYVDVAGPYNVEGKYDSVAWFCHRALETIKQYETKDTNSLVVIYNNLSTVYTTLRQPDKAIFYLRQAEEMLAGSTMQERLIGILTNLGAVYAGKKDYVNARLYCTKAIEAVKRFPESLDVKALGNIYYTLGRTYLDEGKGEEARSSFLSALEAERKYPTPEGDASYHLGLAEAYGLLKDYPRQEKSLTAALASAQRKEMTGDILVYIYSEMGTLYANTGNYVKAYHYRDLAATLRDSVLSREKLEITTQLDVKYRTAEKDKELIEKQLLLARRENDLRKKNYWITGISGASLFLILIIASIYRNHRQKHRIQLERLNLLQKEKEISNLRSVITGEERERTRLARELHDGIMVLFSAIKMKLRGLSNHHVALKEDKDFIEVTAELDLAIRELRRTAHNLMPDMLLEGGLAEAVFYFCKSFNDSSSLDIVFQQYGELPRLQEEFELSLYRIVQELVQNIIKHAQASKAIIQLNYRDDLLCITVEDNGIGFSDSADHSGMGIKSIRTRVRSLNGTLDIRSNQEQGTTVYMEFDIRTVIRTKNNEHVY